MDISAMLISKELIKPSSPTPSHLRRHEFSYFDQLTSHAHRVKVLILFEANDLVHYAQKSLALKKGIREALIHFYPLAGRIKSDGFVECNDEGVEYSEVRVDCDMSYVVEEPEDNQVLDKLIPGGNTTDRDDIMEEAALVSIRFSAFQCGGTALGISFLHKICDGESFNMFGYMWAIAAQRGGDIARQIVKPPDFSAATLFPPSSVPLKDRTALMISDKVVTKKFVFDQFSISDLKETAVRGGVEDPTLVEVVSAFIWRRLMAVSESKSMRLKKKRFVACPAVSIRQRMVPPLHHMFGNLIVVPFATSHGGETQRDYHAVLVKKLRNAIKTVDTDYVTRILSDQGDMSNCDCDESFVNGDINGVDEIELFHFISWSRFAVNEIDFGWGKPVSCTTTSRPCRNFIILAKTKNGDAVEAFLTLTKDDMYDFERDPELLSLLN